MLLSFICLMLYSLLAVNLVAVLCSIGKIDVSGAAVSLIDYISDALSQGYTNLQLCSCLRSVN